MEYRKLPHGDERISVVGLGMGGIHASPPEEIERMVDRAIEGGINYFDMCGGHSSIYAPFGRAIAGRRDKVHFQLHLGVIYNEQGEYGRSRKMDETRRTFEWMMETMGVDTVDMGFMHCFDEIEDFEAMVVAGGLEYLKQLKDQGIVRHLGFSSHTPAVANHILDTGLCDIMMFSINPAYDYGQGDDYALGSVSERAALFRRCESEGVGISVMKPFCAGKLLSADASPYKKALTHYQCIQYALDRPGVLTTLPGVQTMADVERVLGFASASAEEKDYSILGDMTAEWSGDSCVYCNHCQPCPAGIDVGLVNKYYDLARMGDSLAADHYARLSVRADSCLHCGHCDSTCPFHVHQTERMDEIAAYFAQKVGV